MINSMAVNIETLGSAIYKMRACCGDTETYRRVIAATLAMVESQPLTQDEYNEFIRIAAEGPFGIDSHGGD